MKPINDWNNVQASNDDFKRPGPGGYICKIISAVDVPEKEYLRIEYDIAAGEFKDHWQTTMEQFKWWGGDFYRSYKESALGMFKGFTDAVEGSNKGYTWDWDEKGLSGKLIGLVLGEEEYVKNDGSIGIRLKVRSTKTVDQINEGRFRIPKLKKLDGENAPSASAQAAAAPTISIDDMPF